MAIFPCTVTQVISRQRIKVKANASYPSGDYKLVVKSRGGDPDGPLQTSFRNVKYIHTDPPPAIPTITQVEQLDHLPACISFGTEDPTLISGTNLERFDATRGDKLIWELWENGVLKQTSDGTSDIMSVDPVIACPRGVNLEPQLDPNDWHGHSGKVAVVINGQRADFPVSYVI